MRGRRARPAGTARFELGAANCYVRAMARGWESKSIESQQDEAQQKRVIKPALTAEERDRAQRRQTLELALARTQAELQTACHAAHRDMLHLKLESLKAELGRL
jgi:hypothetical protein